MKKFNVSLPAGYQPITDEVLGVDSVFDRKGRSVLEQIKRPEWNTHLPGSVAASEARVLASLVLEHKCMRCLETGVANGGSTLAIAQAAKEIGGHLWGIDPMQISGHQGAALKLLAKYNLEDVFTLLEGPTHTEAPKLLGEGVPKFDLVYVDGHHGFGYKFLDCFYANLLLREGGWLVLHDLWLPSVKKLLRYFRSTDLFEEYLVPSLSLHSAVRLRLLVAACLKRKPMCWFWSHRFANLLVMRKSGAPDPIGSQFRNF